MQQVCPRSPPLSPPPLPVLRGLAAASCIRAQHLLQGVCTRAEFTRVWGGLSLVKSSRLGLVTGVQTFARTSGLLLTQLTLSLQLLVNVFLGAGPLWFLFKFLCPYCLGGTLREDSERTYWIGAAASAILIGLYCCLPVYEG